ncbi:MAG: hypothetical protein JWO38_4688, partial [Gemmataceae bacterium]|nr:hypothetical protein [Gemmataceae bacterium]
MTGPGGQAGGRDRTISLGVGRMRTGISRHSLRALGLFAVGAAAVGAVGWYAFVREGPPPP